MDNQTSNKDFHFLAFSSSEKFHPFLSVVFFSLYFIGILWNLAIIIVIFMDTHLHTPMYFFLCNLSVEDICSTTVTLPKLIYILLSGNNSITPIQCFTQMSFFILMATTITLLLPSMAYDCYVAICNPLNYHRIMNKDKCVLLLIGIWITGCVNAFFLTSLISSLPLCKSTNIHQFYCDGKALAKITCPDIRFSIIFFLETILLGFLPFLLTLVSYIKIIGSVLSMKSNDSRRKAFSTCTSHLTVLFIFYGTLMCVYLKSLFKQTEELDNLFSVLYTAVTPMLNPAIYSLRNREVKNALMKILVHSTNRTRLVLKHCKFCCIFITNDNEGYLQRKNGILDHKCKKQDS
ncbi:olfactory receptor-like protein OLF4 [Bombina bombina]|uniref:olfactory receptor-like protein OLF4 n=1 Tax=Bombina bombina TaxID=8345 RepID=UPI00235ADA1F|nr:olfactory receptor-like protein OLF4 [Bombina bombina]